METYGRWEPIEVEVVLLPGLPGIQFLGLPDQAVKESATRIKSALRHEGFEFPEGRTIVVNLRPSHLKKSSRGVELAVAAAYLIESGQVSADREIRDSYFFGELSLTGEILPMENILWPSSTGSESWVTGPVNAAPVPRWELSRLRDLIEPKLRPAAERIQMLRPKEFDDFEFSESMAEALMVAAVGGHPILLAGKAGAGKTTFARVLHALMPGRLRFPDEPAWWPFVAPHHSIPKISLLGGGNRPQLGELARADRGVLLLDELLEFKGDVLEGLREPLEREEMEVSRAGQRIRYPVRAQVVATTNLCPCGKWVPPKPRDFCRYSRLRCGAILQRLSGPLLDRFQMAILVQSSSGGEKVTFSQLLQRVEAARNFQSKVPSEYEVGESPHRRTWDSFSPQEQAWSRALRKHTSRRRHMASLRVARSLADLSGSISIQKEHVEKAQRWTLDPFEMLIPADAE